MNPIRAIGKKKLRTLLAIFAVTFTTLVLIDVALNPIPPRIIFIDRDNDVALSGSVYLDDVYLGQATEKGFNHLPDAFCSGNLDLIFETDQGKYAWPATKEDCSSNFVAYVIEKSAQVRSQVTMKFFVKETEEPLQGALYFNSEFMVDINGQVIVDVTRCLTIQSINLTAPTYTAEWFHHTRWCQAYATIEYSIPLAELNRTGQSLRDALQ